MTGSGGAPADARRRPGGACAGSPADRRSVSRAHRRGAGDARHAAACALAPSTAASPWRRRPCHRAPAAAGVGRAPRRAQVAGAGLLPSAIPIAAQAAPLPTSPRNVARPPLRRLRHGQSCPACGAGAAFPRRTPLQRAPRARLHRWGATQRGRHPITAPLRAGLHCRPDCSISDAPAPSYAAPATSRSRASRPCARPEAQHPTNRWLTS
jgi:hypothetical protein